MATSTSHSHSKTKTQKVVEVKKVSLTILKSMPPKLEIKATGLAPIGSTDAQLEPYIYTHFPLNGIQDFDFTVSAPDTDALEEITTVHTWPDYPSKLTGVSIHAETNKVVEMLNATQPAPPPPAPKHS